MTFSFEFEIGVKLIVISLEGMLMSVAQVWRVIAMWWASVKYKWQTLN